MLKYRFLLLFSLLFLSTVLLQAQSSALEAQYNKTTDKTAKMRLAYQIAEKNIGSNSSKASTFAHRAFTLASELKDEGMMARASMMDGQALLKERNLSAAKTRFKECVDHAAKNNDLDLATKAYDALEDIAKRSNNYSEAYAYSEQAVALLKSKKGIKSSSSESNAARTHISEDEKKRLQYEIEDLEDILTQLSKERDALVKDKSQFSEKEKKLSQQTEIAKSEVSAKEQQLMTAQEEKEAAIQRTARRDKMVTRLSKQMLADSLVYMQDLQKKNDQISEIEIQAEKSKNLRNLFFAISIGGLAIAGLFLKLFIDNRKAKTKLEEKNKIIQLSQERSDELLHNILPEPIARELKEKNEVKASLHEDVSVLFSDFTNFTQISEKLTPDQLVKEIDHCFRAFDTIISFYHIEKIKTIGDAYMCAAGLIDKRSNAKKLVQAALEIQEFLEEYKAEKIIKGEPYFEARIGIHNGPVVAGVVGRNKFAYDIWGDAVNTASRMESNCEPGRINISESVYWQVKYDYNCIHRGKIAAKNKGEIDMYYVDRN